MLQRKLSAFSLSPLARDRNKAVCSESKANCTHLNRRENVVEHYLDMIKRYSPFKTLIRTQTFSLRSKAFENSNVIARKRNLNMPKESVEKLFSFNFPLLIMTLFFSCFSEGFRLYQITPVS